jgi:hypothetical protein
VVDGKTQGQIKKIVADLGEDHACDLIQAFLQMNDPWFITKAHDFITFQNNLTKVSTALQTGQDLGAKPRKKTLEELLREDEQGGTSIFPTTNG